MFNVVHSYIDKKKVPVGTFLKDYSSYYVKNKCIE